MRDFAENIPVASSQVFAEEGAAFVLNIPTIVSIASLVSAAIAVVLLFHVRQGRKSLSKSIADLKRRTLDREVREKRRVESAEAREKRRVESAEARWKKMDARLNRIDERLLQIESCFQALPHKMEEIKASVRPASSIDASLHVVISLPKCGSSTMARTVAKAFSPAKVFHIHNLSKQSGDQMMKGWGSTDLNGEELKGGLAYLRLAREARMAVEERRARHGSPVGYYLCGVRDPVASAVSAFFHRFKPDDTPIDWLTIRDRIAGEDVMSETGLFEKGVDLWFNREFRDLLGIDVFSASFDFSQGYRIFENSGARLLVIRQENFDGLQCALSELYRCHEKAFEIVSANRATDKPVSDIYREALDRLKFDEGLLNRVYSSRYARHFFSEPELEAFRSKWIER